MLLPHTAAAQEDCDVICTPSVSIQPSIQTVNFLSPATVRILPSGEERELEMESYFSMIVATSMPTALPRTSLDMELIWTPFANTNQNPYTEYTANSLDVDAVDANSLTVQWGVSYKLLTFKQTGGIYATSLKVLDQVSPAAQPDDTRSYTHKLQLEWAGSWGIFKWLPKNYWLRNVTLSTSLQYVATGLPEEGDEVPKNGQVYLQDASPWAFFAGLSLPLAPLTP